MTTIDIDEAVEGYIDAALFADCMPSCETCMAGTWQTSPITGDISFVHGDGTVEHYYECEECANAFSGGMNELDVSDDDRAYVRRLVEKFVDENRADCEAYIEENGDWHGRTDSLGRDYYTASECLGHDLRMTGSGHGVGFWDRGLGDLGERLTDACSPRTPFSREGHGDVWQETPTTARFDHWPLEREAVT